MGADAKPIIPHRVFITSVSADCTAATSPVMTNEPLKRSTKPMDTLADLVATSAAIMAASLGVMVKIPMAPEASISPSFRYRSSVGFAITWARVTCSPGTNSCIIRFFSSSSIKSARSS